MLQGAGLGCQSSRDIRSARRIANRKFKPLFSLSEREPIHCYRLQGVALARHTLGAAAASNAELAKFVEDCGDPASIELAEVYAWRGEGDLAFEWSAPLQRATGNVYFNV
jgi:hypothetical protein